MAFIFGPVGPEPTDRPFNEATHENVVSTVVSTPEFNTLPKTESASQETNSGHVETIKVVETEDNNNNYDNDDSGTKAERESGESVPTATADETARCGCNWCGSR